MNPSALMPKQCLVGFYVILASLLSTNGAHAQLYAGNFYNSNLVEYDSNNGALINASVSSTFYPTDMVISNGDLFVSNEGSSTISEYDASTGALINAALVSAGGYSNPSGLYGPLGIAVSGNDLYVVNIGDTPEISEYNVGTGAPINSALVTGLSFPESIAVLGNDLYVSNEVIDTIGVYNASTGAAINTSFIPVGGGDIAISGNNLYVVTGNSNNVIAEYNATTGALINGSLVSGLDDGQEITIAGDDLYVANFGSNMIGEYNATTGATINASLVSGSGLHGVLSIAVRPQAPPVIPASTATSVSPGSSYATVPPISSTGGFGTSLSLLGGTNSTGTSQTVTLAITNGGAGFTSLASDVVSVSGNDGSIFAVQLTFDLSAASRVGGASNMTLLWRNPADSEWSNAILGDHETNDATSAELDFQGSFSLFQTEYGDNLSSYLGAYGVDTTDGEVWAVIDHNSDFAVGNLSDLPQPTPEPSTWALLLGGAGMLAFWRERLSKSRSFKNRGDKE